MKNGISGWACFPQKTCGYDTLAHSHMVISSLVMESRDVLVSWTLPVGQAQMCLGLHSRDETVSKSTKS